MGINVRSCNQIDMIRRVNAGFILHLLTGEQKQTLVEISLELLASGKENVLKNIIIGDGTWIYGYDIETKVLSTQNVDGCVMSPLVQEKVRISRSVGQKSK